MEKRLYRSRSDRMISGVCGGLAAYLNLDPTLVRIVTVLLGFMSFGTALLLYLILAVIMPLEPAASQPQIPTSAAGEEPVSVPSESDQ